MLLRAVLLIKLFVATPYGIVDSVHLMNLAKAEPLEDVAMCLISIEVVAFLAEIVLTVCAMV